MKNTSSQPNWEKVATALALLVVRHTVPDRPLLEDADSAARMAGLEGSHELRRAVELALRGTTKRVRVGVREHRGRQTLVTATGGEPEKLVERVGTVGL